MFQKELDYIKSNIIRNMTIDGIGMIPNYFYHVPASSSGKYHPQYALGDGGLYRHVQALVIIANELFRMKDYSFSKTEKDLIISSIILHDGWKQGFNESGITIFEHPTLAAQILWRNIETHNLKEKYYLAIICLNIMSHMGQWNYDSRTGSRLLPPITKMQKFVHLCDFIGSRRPLEVTLDK